MQPMRLMFRAARGWRVRIGAGDVCLSGRDGADGQHCLCRDVASGSAAGGPVLEDVRDLLFVVDTVQ